MVIAMAGQTAVLTPNDGVHVYLGQNGHELGNDAGRNTIIKALVF
jgi:hypothetical protein